MNDYFVPYPAGSRADYRPRYVPRSLKAQVGQRALLGSIAKGGPGIASTITTAATNVRRCWHGRLHDLHQAGWAEADPTARLGKAMRACTPASYLPKCRGVACGRAQVCPDCWARQAMEVWEEVDEIVFPTDPETGRWPHVRDDLVLLERAVTYRFPPAVKRPDGVAVRSLGLAIGYRLAPGARKLQKSRYRRGAPPPFLCRPKEITRLRRLGVWGGLDATQVDLVQPKGREPRWKLTFHQILLVPAAEADRLAADPRVTQGGTILGGRAPTVRVRRHERLTRKALAWAVARSFRYPDLLLHAPPELVLESFAAWGEKSRYRRFVRFGGLWGADSKAGIADGCG